MSSVARHSIAATYHLLAALPSGLFVGEALIVELELANCGRAPWLTSGAYPVRVGYRWLNAAGFPVVADGGRAALPAPVPPGMLVRAELRVEAPPEPGNYTLQIELLEEGMAWFSHHGIPPLNLAVSFAAATAPRVAILNGNVIAKDAVGGHVVTQLQTMRAAGFQVLVITGFVDQRLPADLRRSMTMVMPEQLRDPIPATQAAAEQFAKADLVIVNYSSYYDLVELIREVRRGIVIFDYHGITPPELWGREWPGYEDLVRGHSQLNLVRYADYAVGHSQFTCDELIATGQIAPSRVSLLPYAVVETSAYADGPSLEVVERFGLRGHHILLYVGRMARNKHVHDLIAAMPAILTEHPKTLLLLVGDDQLPAYRGYAAELRAQAVALGVADQVQPTGQVDDATLGQLYRACTIFVTASIHEGFCMPVVEAMAHGRPVVAANCSGTPHTLGGAGLLFNPGDVPNLVKQVCGLLNELPAPAEIPRPLAIHQLAPASTAERAALRQRKIAVVTPRYGLQVLGGAETGLRSWAEQLAACGYQVEALSTCTLDMADWRNQLKPGVTQLNGVTVRHFASGPVDLPAFYAFQRRLNRGERLRYSDEQRLMEVNLRSADLERYVAEHSAEYACLIYAPYLFATSYWPALSDPERAVLMPCLHDEPAAHLTIFRELMERCAALIFNTQAESELASHGLGVANPYRVCLGFGFSTDAPPGDSNRFRARTGISGPLLLYSGRLEPAKNVPLLIEWFTRYKQERPTPLTLALTGVGSVKLPVRPDIISLGQLDDEQSLRDTYAAALALCQLSLNESFSLVLMEAWLQGRPVIVHADCAVTREHVARSGGGYATANYQAFRAALDELLADAHHADHLGARGRAYVHEHYSWEVLLQQFEAALATLLRPRSRYARLAQRGVARALAFTRQRFADQWLTLVEQALATTPPALLSARQEALRYQAQQAALSQTAPPEPALLGAALAWLRRRFTRTPPQQTNATRNDQAHFNRELIETLLPTLDESLREQRRLGAELELLRAQLEAQQGERQ